MKERFGARLKQLRKELGLTQEQLADSFGVTVQAVSKWETAASYPDIELLPRIADYFGVTVDELLGGELAERAAAVAPVHEAAEQAAREKADAIESEDDTEAEMGAEEATFGAEGTRGRFEAENGTCTEGKRMREAAKLFEGIGGQRVEGLPDDDVVRICWCRGNTLLGAGSYDPEVRMPIELKISDEKTRIKASLLGMSRLRNALTVAINGSVDIEGDIDGDIHAGGNVSCGDVDGDINAGGNASCGEVNGDIRAGGAAQIAGDVGGDVTASGDVNCADIDGDLKCSGSVKAGSIAGDVRAGGSIECADICGDASAARGITCSSVKGDVSIK